MAGFAARKHPAEGTLDDLYVKALSLEAPDGGVGPLVTADLEAIPKWLYDHLSAELQRRFHLDRSRKLGSRSRSSNCDRLCAARAKETSAPMIPRLVACAMLLSGTMNHTDDTNEQVDGSYLTKGVLGALLGAAVGVGVMVAFYALAGFRFPLLGVGIGILTGYGCKRLSGGGEILLGKISGGIALAAVVGTLFLMYGEFPILSIVSVVISASLANRIASS